eukprot:758708-Hanusia_phi.AAC.4
MKIIGTIWGRGPQFSLEGGWVGGRETGWVHRKGSPSSDGTRTMGGSGVVVGKGKRTDGGAVAGCCSCARRDVLSADRRCCKVCRS